MALRAAAGRLDGLSLCAGIGGLDLGLAAAVPGYATVCYVEREAFCAGILAARMADGRLHDAPIWSDLATFDGRPWRGLVDVVSAGYPCQPFSLAGKRAGAADPRHLWPHVARIIDEVQPAYAFLENVPGHVRLGLQDVRADLLRMGYDVHAGIFSAAQCGAPHLRKRLFVFASHADRAAARNGATEQREAATKSAVDGEARKVADTGRVLRRDAAGRRSMGAGTSKLSSGRQHYTGEPGERGGEIPNAYGVVPRRIAAKPPGQQNAAGPGADGKVQHVADTDGEGRPQSSRARPAQRRRAGDSGGAVADTISQPGRAARTARLDVDQRARRVHAERQKNDGRPRGGGGDGGSGAVKPRVGVPADGPAARLDAPWSGDWERGTPRVAEGTPHRIDQLRALGNAVVPQVAALAFATLAAEWADAQRRL